MSSNAEVEGKKIDKMILNSLARNYSCKTDSSKSGLNAVIEDAFHDIHSISECDGLNDVVVSTLLSSNLVGELSQEDVTKFNNLVSFECDDEAKRLILKEAKEVLFGTWSTNDSDCRKINFSSKEEWAKVVIGSCFYRLIQNNNLTKFNSVISNSDKHNSVVNEYSVLRLVLDPVSLTGRGKIFTFNVILIKASQVSRITKLLTSEMINFKFNDLDRPKFLTPDAKDIDQVISRAKKFCNVQSSAKARIELLNQHLTRSKNADDILAAQWLGSILDTDLR